MTSSVTWNKDVTVIVTDKEGIGKQASGLIGLCCRLTGGGRRSGHFIPAALISPEPSPGGVEELALLKICDV